MKKHYTVPLSILSLILIAFLCTSYIQSLRLNDVISLEEGAYEISALGDIPLNLEGSVFVNIDEVVLEDGKSYTTMNLKLEGDGEVERHLLEIYIADPEISRPFTKRTYAVTENIQGFINDFRGVFGFADIDRFGELPFFTKKGQISIFHTDHKRMAGNLKLTLMNTLGRTIELEGDFTAAHNR